MTQTEKQIDYFVVSTTRSGSTLFCDILHNNRLLKSDDLKASEYFHQAARSGHQEFITNNSIAAFIRKATGEQAIHHDSGALLCGFKILADQLYWLTLHCMEDKHTADFLFRHARYIYLRRHNKIQQAISWLRASNENQWHITQDQARLDSPVQKDYSNESILRAIEHIQIQEQWIDRYFRKLRIHPLKIYYEDIVHRPVDALKAVTDFLGLAAISEPNTNTVYKQMRNAFSLQLEDRFKQQTADSSLLY